LASVRSYKRLGDRRESVGFEGKRFLYAAWIAATICFPRGLNGAAQPTPEQILEDAIRFDHRNADGLPPKAGCRRTE
jgi:hypothetical protein